MHGRVARAWWFLLDEGRQAIKIDLFLLDLLDFELRVATRRRGVTEKVHGVKIGMVADVAETA